MATAQSNTPISGALSNDEAAALIEMILANTNTSSVSARVVVPESPRSLADIFPVSVLAGV